MQETNTAPQFDANGIKLGTVESRLGQAMNAAATEVAKAEREAKMVKAVKLLSAFERGMLTFAQWKALPAQMQIVYKRKFGRPKLATELRAEAKKLARRKARNKAARVSRRINRA